MRRQVLTFSYILIIGMALFSNSCSDPQGPDMSKLKSDKESPFDPQAFRGEVIEYFKEIALGFEGDWASEITRKWNKDLLIFVEGDVYKPVLDELDKIILELNHLIASDKVKIMLTKDRKKVNHYVSFGTYVGSNYGKFFVDFNEMNYIIKANILVDTQRASYKKQLHLLREELTQTLGLGQDSSKYPNSIFQESYSTDVTEFSKHDKAVIKLLYHPKMEVGLDATQVDPILDKIVDEVIAEVLESEE